MKKYSFWILLALFSTTIPLYTMLRITALTTPYAQILIKRYLSHIGTNNSLTKTKIEKLKRVFPEQVLIRYTRDFKITNKKYTEKLKEEWVKYAYLARYYNQPLSMFSKDVDNLWHIFLLFNKDYEAFCSHLPPSLHGSQLLYHIPQSKTETCPTTCQWVQKALFITLYQDLYKQDPDKTIWTALNSCESSNCLRKQEISEAKESSNSDSSGCLVCGGGGCG